MMVALSEKSNKREGDRSGWLADIQRLLPHEVNDNTAQKALT